MLAVLVLLVAWFSPQLLRPSIWDGNGGGTATSFAGAEPQVLTTTVMDTESWLPFTVVGVGDVPGARVLGAWLVTGPDARTAERGVAGSPASAEDHLAEVLASPADAQLPRRVTSGGPTALLVLWAVDDCGALQADAEPVVTLRNVVGAGLTDRLPDFSAPRPDLVAVEAPDTGPAVCTGG